MSFRLGLVGLCTSHPQNWIPIIRQLVKENYVDLEIVAAWDSGQTRPKGFAKEFSDQFNIPTPVEDLKDMVDMVDGVIVHTTNWDSHLDHARVFVEADKAVFLDKPIVGNTADAEQLMDWEEAGKRITGGSSLRYTYEVRDYLARPLEQRGKIVSAFVGCGVDEFNYGIHAYSLLSGLMGTSIEHVQALQSQPQKLIKIQWNDGRTGIISILEKVPLPFHLTIITDVAEGFSQLQIDSSRIYRALLESVLPYLTGKEQNPPFKMRELLEPELAAIAARISWLNDGEAVFLDELKTSDDGYDGVKFATEYKNARMTAS